MNTYRALMEESTIKCKSSSLPYMAVLDAMPWTKMHYRHYKRYLPRCIALLMDETKTWPLHVCLDHSRALRLRVIVPLLRVESTLPNLYSSCWSVCIYLCMYMKSNFVYPLYATTTSASLEVVHFIPLFFKVALPLILLEFQQTTQLQYIARYR